MKIARPFAAATGLALAGVVGLAAAPAFAAEGDTYITAAQIGTEGDSYPAGWFAGDTGDTDVTVVSDLFGLTVDGTYQLLNGTTPSTDIVGLVDGAEVNISQGAATFQIPIFANGADADEVGFTTLRPVTASTPGDFQLTATEDWVTSRPLGTYAAGAVAPLADFAAELPDTYEILAYGVFVDPGTVTSINSISWGDVTSRFNPVPVVTGPATVVEGTLATSTEVFTFSGFVPGEQVYPGYGAGQSGDALPGEYFADEAGVVTVPVSAFADFAVGEYTVGTGFAEVSGENATAAFTVTAAAAVPAPAAPAAPQLAATGVETLFAGATALTLLLAGLALVALRRQARTDV